MVKAENLFGRFDGLSFLLSRHSAGIEGARRVGWPSDLRACAVISTVSVVNLNP